MAGAKFWPADPNPTRLFFGPTARSLKRGEGYLGVYEVVMPFVQVGVTNRLSVGGGTPIWFGNGGDRVFWFTPKVTVFDRGRTSAAAGVMHMTGIEDDSIGVAYGVVTHGTRDTAITVGGGYAYATGGDTLDTAPVLMDRGEHRRAQCRSSSPNSFGMLFELFNADLERRLSRFTLASAALGDLGLVDAAGADEASCFSMVNCSCASTRRDCARDAAFVGRSARACATEPIS